MLLTLNKGAGPTILQPKMINRTLKILYLLIILSAQPLQSRRVNEVYTVRQETFHSHEIDNAAAEDQTENELREFVMSHIEDREICRIQWLRDLIIGKNGTGIGWWSRRCFVKSGQLPAIPPSSDRNHRNTDLNQVTKSVTAKLSKNFKDSLCRPIRQLVTLRHNDTIGAVYMPCTVMVKRCAGCCVSEIKECVPTQTKEKTFIVLKIVPKSSRKRSVRKYSMIPNSSLVHKIKVAEHKQCECQCKIKPIDCRGKQVFDPDACDCICPSEITRTCSSSEKVWSEKHCSCLCRKTSECTTGLEFNINSCRCEKQNVLEMADFKDRSSK